MPDMEIDYNDSELHRHEGRAYREVEGVKMPRRENGSIEFKEDVDTEELLEKADL